MNAEEKLKYVWKYKVPLLVIKQQQQKELDLNIHVKILPCKSYKLSSI